MRPLLCADHQERLCFNKRRKHQIYRIKDANSCGVQITHTPSFLLMDAVSLFSTQSIFCWTTLCISGLLVYYSVKALPSADCVYILLKEQVDSLGIPLICILAKSCMKTLIPLSCLFIKYRTGGAIILAQHNDWKHGPTAGLALYKFETSPYQHL